ncbi:MAG TPA: hypothetical protein VFQ51_05515 [Vicinamibacteria bacterium]|nr:hypothetical protein [Vicinamibacteria bacterium]
MRLSLLGALALGASALAASAGAESWIPVGPPGGDVRSLAADPRDPSRIYLGTADGVLYRSDDGGRRWRRMAPGFPTRGQSLDDIVVDSDGGLYVGYWTVETNDGGGVARSTDGGQTFTVLKGIEGQAVRALAQAPSAANVLVAGTLTGVFRTGDSGRTWRRISPEGHIDLKNVGSVAFDPGAADTIYAGTWHLPWKTRDGGRTWYPISKGLIDDSDIMTITIDRQRPPVVYATACSGIYKSVDAAARWSKIRGIPSSSRRTRAFAQSPNDPQLLLAGTTEGLWLSRDGGATWQQATRKDLVLNAVLALPSGVVLLGADGIGVLRSDDGARTFFASNDGFSERFVSRMAFDPQGGRILVGIWGDRRHGGVLTAPDARGPWTRLAEGLEGREVLALATSGPSVLAGTDDGVFAWTASAGAWTRLPTIVGRIEAHPRVNDIAVVSDQEWMLATSKGLLRTADAGRTWQRTAVNVPGPASVVAVSPRDPRLVLAATAIGFYRSVDGGMSWTSAGGMLDGAEPHRLLFLPTNDTVAFTATSRGLFRTMDRGVNWARHPGGVPFTDITGLASDPRGQTLYASDFGTGGVFRSGDGGETWRRFSADGLVTERVWTLAVDPRAPDRVFAATPSGGLHLLHQPAAARAAGGSSE